VSPAHKKQVVAAAVQAGVCSGRAGCRILGLSRSGYAYQAGRRSSRLQALVRRIHALTAANPRYGYRRIAALLRQEGWSVGKRQVRRLRRLEGLRVPPTKRKLVRRGHSTGRPTKATHRNHVWTWDFIADATMRGGALRMLTVLDEHTRECHVLRADRALKSGDVIKLVQGAIRQHGAPEYIRSDNGSEFIAKELQHWLAEAQIRTIYIEPGSPWQNGFVESFHGRFRDECLNREQLWTLTEARVVIEDYRNQYNQQRPHSNLGYRSPAQSAASLTPSLALVRPAEPDLPSARDASVITTSTNRPDRL
jgi:transposase InsO family protein